MVHQINRSRYSPCKLISKSWLEASLRDLETEELDLRGKDPAYEERIYQAITSDDNFVEDRGGEEGDDELDMDSNEKEGGKEGEKVCDSKRMFRLEVFESIRRHWVSLESLEINQNSSF